MHKRTLALLGTAALALGGCGGKEDKRQLVLQGNVDVRQVSLAFEDSGRVAEVRAQEGDSVKAGVILATLDTVSLKLQAEEASAQGEVQRQNLLRLRNGSRPEEIAQARARLASTEAEAARAEGDLARLRGIAASTQGRGVSAQDIDHASKEAVAARAKAREQAEALRLTRQGPRAEDVAGGEAQVKAAQAQVALLQHRINQGVLRAPVDGVVRSRLLEPGDMASPQKAVFAIALAHPKWVRVYVNQPDLGRIRPGMAASVVSDSLPDQTIPGTIGYISSVAEFTPKSVETEELRTSLVYEVRVQVEDKANRLRLGQPVTVRLDTGRGDGGTSR
ncbi:HlyD family efflux transporter periplasmic adaptor subunit [Sphingomonas abaci]|uniref:HlyD family secretion protein n=1 Tax=Sphingomonas abaci TaxID=237611 RepID=A0A7W7F1S2_9SPHN|nr:HlyD family efflux transporter periplasmic adaptor subunit [Sphingomonas abaci]MBB4619655.1 HlyD family secretion protein [Sphingomonas abaci]